MIRSRLGQSHLLLRLQFCWGAVVPISVASPPERRGREAFGRRKRVVKARLSVSVIDLRDPVEQKWGLPEANVESSGERDEETCAHAGLARTFEEAFNRSPPLLLPLAFFQLSHRRPLLSHPSVMHHCALSALNLRPPLGHLLFYSLRSASPTHALFPPKFLSGAK